MLSVYKAALNLSSKKFQAVSIEIFLPYLIFSRQIKTKLYLLLLMSKATLDLTKIYFYYYT